MRRWCPRLLALRRHEIVILAAGRGSRLGGGAAGPYRGGGLLDPAATPARSGGSPGCAACERRIDVIHTDKSSAHSFGALLRLFYGVPCVPTAHSLNYQLHWAVNDRVVCHNEESMRLVHEFRAAAQFSADVNIPKLEAILAEAAGRA